MSATHTVHTLYRTAMHIMLPIPYYITNTDYMMKAMRFDQAAEQFDLFVLISLFTYSSDKDAKRTSMDVAGRSGETGAPGLASQAQTRLLVVDDTAS